MGSNPDDVLFFVYGDGVMGVLDATGKTIVPELYQNIYYERTGDHFLLDSAGRYYEYYPASRKLVPAGN